MTNALARFGKFRTAPMSEVTVFDVAGQRVESRRGRAGKGTCSSGRPGTRAGSSPGHAQPDQGADDPDPFQGWTITNGIAVLWKGGRVDQLLLSTNFADITDVAFTPDETALATSARTRSRLIDVEKMLALLKRPPTRIAATSFPTGWGVAEFAVVRIPVKDNPAGITVAPDGLHAWVANTLDDSLSVDVARNEGVVHSAGRSRERTSGGGFHSANVTFQRESLPRTSAHRTGTSMA